MPAKTAAASLAGALGKTDRAAGLTNEAESLRQQFEESFW